MNIFKLPFELIQKILYALYELYKLIKGAKNETPSDEQK